MTKKRKLAVLAVAAVGLVVGLVLYLQSLPRTPFQARYVQVRRGMTAEEVHSLIGNPGVTISKDGSPAEEQYDEPADSCLEFATINYAGGKVVWKSFRQQDWEPGWLEAVRRKMGF
jgi:hypothetical protein